MQIIIKTMAGDTITLDSEPSETIEDIKQKIKEKLGIKVYRQGLVIAGKGTDNSMTLCDYGVKNGTLIHLYVKKE